MSYTLQRNYSSGTRLHNWELTHLLLLLRFHLLHSNNIIFWRFSVTEAVLKHAETPVLVVPMNALPAP